MKSFILSLVAMLAIGVGVGVSKPLEQPNPPPPATKARPAKAAPRAKRPAALPSHKPPQIEEAITTLLAEAPQIAQAAPQIPIFFAQAPDPQPKAKEEPPAPATPVSVEIDGMTAYLVGERAVFRLLEAGDVSARTWTILPAGTTGLKIYPGGKEADFVARTPGNYVLLVAVSGKDGSVAQTFHSFELQSNLPPEEEPVQTTSSKSTVEKEVGVKDPVQIVKDFTNAVESPRKAQDMAKLSTALMLTAGGIDSGAIKFPTTANKVRYIIGKAKSQAEISMGELGPWQKWFEELELFCTELERKGGWRTPAGAAAAIRKVASILDGN